MKNLITVSILIAGVFIFSGCGVSVPSDGTLEIVTNTPSQTTQTTQAPRELNMERGKNYQIHKGDKIVKNSPNTIVVVETDIQSNQTVATLESGSATLYPAN